MANLTHSQKKEIDALVLITAAQFVDEFGEPLDGSKTDWDAEAWDDDRRKLSFAKNLKSDSSLYAEAWDYYADLLEAETAALCR